MQRRAIYLTGALVSLALAGVAVSQTLPEPTEAESIAMGRRLVDRNCAMCHAVGATGASPNGAAPAFRDLSARMDVEVLGEGLAQGILTQHPAMPEFRFTPPEVIGIIRYLRSVQSKLRTDSVVPPSTGGQ